MKIYKYKFRVTLEIVVYLYTILLLFIRTKEIHIQGLKMYMQLLMDNPVQMPFLIALICVVLILPMRVTCTLVGEDYLIVLAICFMSFNFFSFLRFVKHFLKPVSIYLYYWFDKKKSFQSGRHICLDILSHHKAWHVEILRHLWHILYTVFTG